MRTAQPACGAEFTSQGREPAPEHTTTEHSYRHAVEELGVLAARAGYRMRGFWTDPQQWPGVFRLELQACAGNSRNHEAFRDHTEPLA